MERLQAYNIRLVFERGKLVVYDGDNDIVTQVPTGPGAEEKILDNLLQLRPSYIFEKCPAATAWVLQISVAPAAKDGVVRPDEVLIFREKGRAKLALRTFLDSFLQTLVFGPDSNDYLLCLQHWSRTLQVLNVPLQLNEFRQWLASMTIDEFIATVDTHFRFSATVLSAHNGMPLHQTFARYTYSLTKKEVF